MSPMKVLFWNLGLDSSLTESTRRPAVRANSSCGSVDCLCTVVVVDIWFSRWVRTTAGGWADTWEVNAFSCDWKT